MKILPTFISQFSPCFDLSVSSYINSLLPPKFQCNLRLALQIHYEPFTSLRPSSDLCEPGTCVVAPVIGRPSETFRNVLNPSKHLHIPSRLTFKTLETYIMSRASECKQRPFFSSHKTAACPSQGRRKSDASQLYESRPQFSHK